MNELGKGNVRRLLQESLYGEIEEYMQACRGIRCPEGWRDEIRDITRRVLELLFYYDEAEITGVEQWGNRLCFTYILRGYGVGENRKGCGGTQSKGGNGGQWISTKIAEKGELFYGGAAISYGGSDGGGGGGSSFIGSLTNGTSVSGVNKGNGYIVIFSRSNNFCTYTQNSQILITYSLVYYMIINSQ